VQDAEGFSNRSVRTRTFKAGWRTLLGGIAALICLALAPACALALAPPVDDSGGAYMILAPGEAGSVPLNEFSTDQSKLYTALTPHEGNVSNGLLAKDYLSEKFETEPGAPIEKCSSLKRPCEEEPIPGARIIRDTKDIPHIFGETREDAMFASGYVGAQDRSLLLERGLGPAYIAALSPPGLNAFELLLTGRSFTPSAQAEEFIHNQLQTLRDKGPQGEQVIEDLENWAEGVNAAHTGLPHVGINQAIAGFAFIGSIFGNGGGAEVSNSNFLARLETKFGETEALKIFHDLRESNDPEAPTTTNVPFPYDKEPSGTPPAGAAVIEPESLSPELVKADAAAKAQRKKMSNFLLVGSELTKAAHGQEHHPVAVMGPQLGYYYPEIVYQEQIQAPGVEAEGVVAPISPYVFIGRGRDFAWSLTSADSENEQTFLLKLCNPEEGGPVTRESEYYERDNECIKMTTLDAGKLGEGNGHPEEELYIKESFYGPVVGTVMVHGKPYAVARDRTTRGHEPEGELAFSDLDSNRVHSPKQFFEAADELGTTFNMAYIDSKNIAFFSTGLLPKLAPETDPALPTFGTGQYDWKGDISLAEHPHVVAPANSTLLNWNNKPAPEWGSASDNWQYGPLQRVQMFNGYKAGKVTEATDVGVMNKASEEDFRATFVWPTIQKVLEASPSSASPLATSADKLLLKWIKSGASLYGTERPKAAAAAVIEAVFDPMEEAVLSPVLGELLGEFESISSVDNGPNSGGSSFGGGWYGYVLKDLRSLLGETPTEPYSRKYCGNGVLKTCSESLWAAMNTALERAATEQGTSNPKKWKAAKVQIEFSPLNDREMNIPWTNRSTFQQVIEFTKHQEEDLEGPLE
jgi:acyl-homoserine lactone acylase PvdQ